MKKKSPFSALSKYLLLSLILTSLLFPISAYCIDVAIPAGGSEQIELMFRGIVMNLNEVEIVVTSEDSALVTAETDRFWNVGDEGFMLLFTMGVDERAEIDDVLHVRLLFAIRAPGIEVNQSRVFDITVLEPPPQADFSAEPLSGSVPLTVTFEDLSRGNVATWLWDFGDNTESDSANPTHIYEFAGEFTVSLTVANEDGVSTTLERRRYIIATDPIPIIAVESDTIDFGEVTVGSESELPIVISNIGNGELNVVDVFYFDSWFDVQYEGAFSINPGESHSIPVVFRPTSARSTSMDVRIISNDPENRITHVFLVGAGIEENSVDPEPKPTPVQFHVSAYPNPFNNVTQIIFGVENSSLTSVGVTDVNGQMVDILYNGVPGIGNHSVSWNATELPAGVYFIQLQSGMRMISKKIVLLK